ncbi:MAG: hypothetical protein HQK76_04600 [Desulfobacterales bacterium]|nr:hypothetical protein [Desulfobacterales bacterium]
MTEDVYLCQINDLVSCGACCGLYNIENISYEYLTDILTYRTVIFQKIPRTTEDILKFKENIEAKENQNRPFIDFHHCPFIGMVGEKKSRVGCLLHPLNEGNKGIDFRGLSFYGGMACRIYFCPSCKKLPKSYKEIVRDLSENWYEFGLIITETKMLNTFFKELENCIGKPIDREEIVHHTSRKAIIKKFLRLKFNWQFKLKSASLCNYFFEDDQYLKPCIDYQSIASMPSKHDLILRELNSNFNYIDELKESENILDKIFDELKHSYSDKKNERF